jgi:hypothetical protein
VATRLVETLCTLPHCLSGRQRGEVHSKLDLHAIEDMSSTSLRNTPILVIAEVEHILLTGRNICCLGLIRRRSTIYLGSRLIRTRRVASEMSPHPLTIKAQTKHHGPLIKVVIESEIWGRYNNGRMSSSHGRRAPCFLSIFFRKRQGARADGGASLGGDGT